MYVHLNVSVRVVVLFSHSLLRCTLVRIPLLIFFLSTLSLLLFPFLPFLFSLLPSPHTQISELPAEIGNFPRLHTLLLPFNTLSSLPFAALLSLPHLATLNISNNQLTAETIPTPNPFLLMPRCVREEKKRNRERRENTEKRGEGGEMFREWTTGKRSRRRERKDTYT